MSARPRLGEAITPRRRIAGFAVALLGGPVLTWLFSIRHTSGLIATELLSFQLLVVIVALVGGIWPALFAAVLSALTLDLFFIEPHLNIAVTEPMHVLTLVLHVAIAIVVSTVVGRAERQTERARRATADAELLQAVAGSVLRGQDAIQALLERTREAFSFACVRLVDDHGTVASTGDPAPDEEWIAFPVDGETRLEAQGSSLAPSARRLIPVIIAQLAAVLERRRLEEVASEIEPLAASDRVRGALLSALSHDLRRPLAAATTAIGGLRAAGGSLSAADERELLETAEESLEALTRLITDLLDVSRVQAGMLTLVLNPVDPADVLVPAIDEFGAEAEAAHLELAVGHGSEHVLADPVLLQRAIVNLVANAIRFSPEESPVELSTAVAADRVEIRIVDHGPGIPGDRIDEIFVPFQRLGDTDNTTGLGLGLALSRGFVEAMHGTLEAEGTPGGGLTMVISLPRATGESQKEAS